MKDKFLTCTLFFVAVFIGLSFGNVFAVGESYHDGIRVGKIFFQMNYLYFALPIAFVLMIFWALRQELDWVTFLLILFIGWILLCGGSIRQNEKVWSFSGGLVFFLLVRSYLAHIDNRSKYTVQRILVILLVVISVVGGIEGFLGQLQVFNRYTIYHSTYRVTGTFFNPAPFAGYLVASLTYAVGLTLFPVKKKAQRVLHWIGWLCVLIMLAVLPATQSRAGWVCLLAASAYFGYHQFCVGEKFAEYYRLKKGLAIFIVTAMSISLCAGGYSVYRYKKESADGRLLIWKVSFDILQQNPWTGVGFNFFQAHYAPALANYFNTGSGSEADGMLAGNVQWAFNEPLHFAAELGFPGGLLFLGLISAALLFPVQDKWRQENYRLILLSAKSSLVAIFIFGLFSYPFYSLPIILLFFFSLAVVASALRFIRVKGISFVFKGAMLVLLILIGFNTYGKTDERKQAYWLWNEGETLYQVQSYEAANESFQKALPVLKTQGQFLQHYGKSLQMAGDFERAVEILNQSGKFYRDDFWYLTLGEAHKQAGNFAEAEKHYTTAAQMVPHKIYPRYLLVKLYEGTGQPLKAMMIAQNILKSEVKVMSPAVRQIMFEMTGIVNKSALEEKNSELLKH